MTRQPPARILIGASALAMTLALSACGPSAPEAVDETVTPEAAPVVDDADAMTTGSEPREMAREGRAPRQDRGPGGEQTLTALERRMLEGFDRLDVNGDGRLTPDELAAGDGPGGARMLRRADLDGDGTLTRDEVREAAAQLFRRMDVNGDGVITDDERPQGRPGGRRDRGPGE